MTTCLDSWAILRWLNGVEPAFSAVDSVLDDTVHDERPVMSWVNVGEVFYITWRSEGPERADEITRALGSSLRLDLATPERVLAAARIKAEHPMALADAFAVATAKAFDAQLLTGDPEIIDAPLDLDVWDLR